MTLIMHSTGSCTELQMILLAVHWSCILLAAVHWSCIPLAAVHWSCILLAAVHWSCILLAAVPNYRWFYWQYTDHAFYWQLYTDHAFDWQLYTDHAFYWQLYTDHAFYWQLYTDHAFDWQLYTDHAFYWQLYTDHAFYWQLYTDHAFYWQLYTDHAFYWLYRITDDVNTTDTQEDVVILNTRHNNNICTCNSTSVILWYQQFVQLVAIIASVYKDTSINIWSPTTGTVQIDWEWVLYIAMFTSPIKVHNCKFICVWKENVLAAQITMYEVLRSIKVVRNVA